MIRHTFPWANSTFLKSLAIVKQLYTNKDVKKKKKKLSLPNRLNSDSLANTPEFLHVSSRQLLIKHVIQGNGFDWFLESLVLAQVPLVLPNIHIVIGRY